MSQTALTTLTKARALISNEGNWTQRAFAKDGKGRIVPFRDKLATRFCAEGACHRASKGFPTAALQILERAAQSMAGKSSKLPTVWAINDDMGHEAVLEMFDRAIKMAKRRRSKNARANRR